MKLNFLSRCDLHLILKTLHLKPINTRLYNIYYYNYFHTTQMNAKTAYTHFNKRFETVYYSKRYHDLYI